MFNYAPEDMKDARVGDIVRLDGKRFRVLKKTNYNVAVEPYTWFDAVWDWMLRLEAKCRGENNAAR